MMRKKLLALLVVSGAMAGVLAGCGWFDDDTKPSDSDDAEPVERKDTAIVEVSSVRKYRHLTTFVGRVVGGDIEPLLREVVTGSLADDRKGALELAPATDDPPRPAAVPDEAVRGWLWADESGEASWLPDTPIPEPAAAP